MSISCVLELLEQTSSRNDKIAILESHKENTLLQRVVHAALNPLIAYHVKKIPDYEHVSSAELTLEEFMGGVLVDLRERTITGHAALDALASALARLSEDDATVAKKIIGRDLRCGVAASTANKVWKGLVPVYPCLLAEKPTEKLLNAMPYPAASQLKMDGMRTNIFVDPLTNVGVVYKGRSGKPIFVESEMLDEAAIHFASNFGNTEPLVLDGELVVLDENGEILPRKLGNGILNKAIQGKISKEESARVRFVMWDVITQAEFYAVSSDVVYEKRWAKAEHWQNVLMTHHKEYIRLCETQIVYDYEEAAQHYNSAVDRGCEGTILKSLSHVWENKRSKGLIKFKAEKEADLIVLEWQPGTKKYTGMLGSVLLGTSDGVLTVSCGSGFDDNFRKNTKPEDIVGKIVTVKYNEIIERSDGAKSLYLPIFVEVRQDKNVANSFSELE